MKLKLTICIFTLLAVASTGLAQKEKTIVISDSLNAHADKLIVKMFGVGVGVSKFKFGDYSIVKTKAGWGTSTEKSKIFNRKTETSSKQKAYFELVGPTADVAHVNTVHEIDSKALREWTWLSYSTQNSKFSIDEESELLFEENTYSAFIAINNDTSDVWSLVMITFSGSQVDPSSKPVALLSNGLRKIYLVPVTSNDRGDDKRLLPAFGYELRENGQALAALQFYGGGAWGGNKSIFWLPQDDEPKMKLLLAAALSAVLQHKMGHTGF